MRYWKNKRVVSVFVTVLFAAGLFWITDKTPEADDSASAFINNVYNVEHYPYNTTGRYDGTTKILKELPYSFCEKIVIPGMPDTKEEDLLRQYIFSETQSPQGLCITEEFVLITSDSVEEDCKGELMVFDRESGEYLTTLGMDADSHLGGIAFDGTNVWVCNSNRNTVERISYDFICLMADRRQEGGVDATSVVDVYPVSNKPSCITFHDGRLWIATHTKFLDSKLVAYHRNPEEDCLQKLSEYSIPSKVQGIAFDEQGRVYLSTSYGRTASSYLKIYDSIAAMSSNVKKTVLQIEMPPCSEEIDIHDGMLYVIFESAGEKYYRGTDGNGTSLAPLDQILQLPVDSLKS